MEGIQLNVKHVQITTGEDLSKIEVSETIKQTFKLCLGNIFESIENQTVSKLKKLKSIFYLRFMLKYFRVFNSLFKDNLKNQGEFLEIKVKYIEEEIDIRVQSIILEVEEAAIRLKDKLNEMKKDALK